MSDGFEYRPYLRRPSAGAGHPKIWVLCNAKGEPASGGCGEGQIQCCTLDRIPFCMKKGRFYEVYAPRPAQVR